jgi:anti-sigma B factor antagonist
VLPHGFPTLFGVHHKTSLRHIRLRFHPIVAVKPVPENLVALVGRITIGESAPQRDNQMALEITQREREGVTILDLKGRITVGPEATALRESVAALNQQAGRNLVFNLGGVDYIDSTGLGALVMSATSLRKNGGNVKLLNLNRRNIELLVMTKLATVFEIFTEEQEGVNSYFPDRKIKKFDVLDFVQKMKKEE